jgi:hypothetical protein
VVTAPVPQRALRGTRVHHPMPAIVNTAEHQAWLAGHLTPRDRWLIRMLFEHKVFTTHQIVDLAFPSQRAANLRLLNLTRWGLLHRFQPHRDLGSHPMHYVLDRAGATVLAHEEGIHPRALNYNRDREIGRAYSLQLAHAVGCNALFTALIHQARQPRVTGELTTWWSASRCGRQWGDIVTPDAYARWQDAARTIEWFTEFDFGTEPLNRLAAKLHRYERLAEHTGIATPILFWLPGPQREANARRILAETLRVLDRPGHVPVATTCPTAAAHPLDMTEPRWLRVDKPGAGRARLIDLPALWPTLPTPTAGGASRTEGGQDLHAPNPMPPGPSTGRSAVHRAAA